MGVFTGAGVGGMPLSGHTLIAGCYTGDLYSAEASGGGKRRGLPLNKICSPLQPEGWPVIINVLQ